MANEDQDLLDKMHRGDEAAFTALYRRRQGPVYRFVLQMTGRPAMAEDVTQEVFLALIEKRARFDPRKGSFGSFLFGVARNLMWKRLDRGEQLEDWDGRGDLVEDLARRETIDAVRRAVVSLPGPYREAVVLCDLQETSYEEAAAALECPVGTVRSRLSRGRALLAQKLAVRA